MSWKTIVNVSVVLLLMAGSILTPLFTYKASAHPGNTSSDGGHYCWTNCSSWGEEYGVRHFHGGGSTYQIDYGLQERLQGYSNGRSHANNINKAYIEDNASNIAQTKGYSDGYQKKAKVFSFYNLSPSLCSDKVEFKTTPTDNYRDAFQSSYSDECESVYSNKYEDVYLLAYSDGKAVYEEEQEELKRKESEQAWNTFWAWAGMILIVLAIWQGAKWMLSKNDKS